MTRRGLAATNRRRIACATAGVLLAALTGPVSLRAEGDPPSFRTAAARLTASTVTVRIALPTATGKPSVTVCTGVVVGPGLVVSSAFASSDAAIRITTTMGVRGEAELRVLDEYSGLVLLESQDINVTPMSLGEGELEVGQWVVAAAAWGAEAPVASFGLVSGLDRRLPESTYPPLIQCDLRSAETSSGAGLVDTRGRLQGLVVATDGRPSQRGWTYAVPVSHVQRLLRSWGQHSRGRAPRPPRESTSGVDGGLPGATFDKSAGRPRTVLILKRRRPELGMELASDESQLVMVRRVRPQSPAAVAGIEPGDQVLAAEGVKVTSVYQAIRPIMALQPGDKLTLLISKAQTGQTREVEVVLGGGVALPAASLGQLGRLVRPKLEVEGIEGGFRSRAGERVREFVSSDDEDDPLAPARAPSPNLDERIRLLEKTLERYRRVIELQQQQLDEAQRQLKQRE